MHRRDFIKLLPAGAIGVGTITLELRERPEVQRYLTKRFNEFSKGMPYGRWPHDIYVSPEIFEAFESSIMTLQRFVSAEVERRDHYWRGENVGFRALAFKSARMHKSERLSGWNMTFQNGERTINYRDSEAFV